VKKLIPAFLFVVLCGVPSLKAEIAAYLFTVNTTSLNGQAGNLDFQLNPGDITSPFVALDISGFVLQGGSFTASDIQLTGDASGSLASHLLLDDGSGYNDAFQPVVLGTSITFLATFSGAGVDNPASPGAVFGFSIYDGAGTTPLLTTSGDGTIAGVNLDANGIVSYTNPATPGGGSDAMVAGVPEPSTWIGMSLGMGLCLVAVRVRRASN
jgi:PEP-CTERM motif